MCDGGEIDGEHGSNGLTDRPKGDYDANSQQAFAELGYALGSGR
ncbi:hypothetical protein [Pseudomonas sp. MWU15-20650]|nr:hypothetical protein [Pseudomonas sp. MWU15-20650]